MLLYTVAIMWMLTQDISDKKILSHPLVPFHFFLPNDANHSTVTAPPAASASAPPAGSASAAPAASASAAPAASASAPPAVSASAAPAVSASAAESCPRLDYVCDCPQSTWALDSIHKMPTQEDICKMMNVTSIFFAGDSIIRDTWSAAAMWLLALDNFEITKMNVSNRVVCMSSAWRFLEPVGIIEALRKAGFLEEILTSEKSISTFKVCHGRVRLIFKYARLFSDLPTIRKDMDAHGGTALVLSHGLLEMSAMDNIQVQAWAKALNDGARGFPTVYLGTHSRITALSPPKFAFVASGTQGNEALQRRYAAVSAEAEPGGLRLVDPFRLTASLDSSYRDTDDGLHFGIWVNLQRFWLVVRCLHDASLCTGPRAKR